MNATQPSPPDAANRFTGSTSESDAALLDSYVRLRDADAFRELVRRFGPMVRAVAGRTVSHREDAEDVTQVVFTELARRAGTVEDAAALGGWLHTITVRTALRVRKRRRGNAELNEQTAAGAGKDPLAVISQRADLATLSEELDELPADWREPLVLRYFAGCDTATAAARMGLSVEAFKGRIKRGKNTLRVRLLRRGVGVTGVLAAALSSVEAEAAAMQAAEADAIWSAVADASLELSGEADITPLFLKETTMPPTVLSLKAVVAAAVVTMLSLSGGGPDGSRRAPRLLQTIVAEDDVTASRAQVAIEPAAATDDLPASPPEPSELPDADTSVTTLKYIFPKDVKYGVVTGLTELVQQEAPAGSEGTMSFGRSNDGGTSITVTAAGAVHESILAQFGDQLSPPDGEQPVTEAAERQSQSETIAIEPWMTYGLIKKLVALNPEASGWSFDFNEDGTNVVVSGDWSDSEGAGGFGGSMTPPQSVQNVVNELRFGKKLFEEEQAAAAEIAKLWEQHGKGSPRSVRKEMEYLERQQRRLSDPNYKAYVESVRRSAELTGEETAAAEPTAAATPTMIGFAKPATPPTATAGPTNRLDRALAAKIDVDFNQDSLSEALDYFTTLEDIQIRVDARALEEDGFALDDEFSLTLSDVALRDALTQILAEEIGGLDYYSRDGVLHVTTETDADEQRTTVAYTVPEGMTASDVSEMITAHNLTSPRGDILFEMMGGSGVATAVGQFVVVTHSDRGHEAVEKFLEAIRGVSGDIEPPSPGFGSGGGGLGSGGFGGGGS